MISTLKHPRTLAPNFNWAEPVRERLYTEMDKSMLLDNLSTANLHRSDDVLGISCHDSPWLCAYCIKRPLSKFEPAYTSPSPEPRKKKSKIAISYAGTWIKCSDYKKPKKMLWDDIPSAVREHVLEYVQGTLPFTLVLDMLSESHFGFSSKSKKAKVDPDSWYYTGRIRSPLTIKAIPEVVFNSFSPANVLSYELNKEDLRQQRLCRFYDLLQVRQVLDPFVKAVTLSPMEQPEKELHAATLLPRHLPLNPQEMEGIRANQVHRFMPCGTSHDGVVKFDTHKVSLHLVMNVDAHVKVESLYDGMDASGYTMKDLDIRYPGEGRDPMEERLVEDYLANVEVLPTPQGPLKCRGIANNHLLCYKWEGIVRFEPVSWKRTVVSTHKRANCFATTMNKGSKHVPPTATCKCGNTSRRIEADRVQRIRTTHRVSYNAPSRVGIHTVAPSKAFHFFHSPIKAGRDVLGGITVRAKVHAHMPAFMLTESKVGEHRDSPTFSTCLFALPHGLYQKAESDMSLALLEAGRANLLQEEVNRFEADGFDFPMDYLCRLKEYYPHTPVFTSGDRLYYI